MIRVIKERLGSGEPYFGRYYLYEEWYCDCCGDRVKEGELYECDGDQLCRDCLLNSLEKKEATEEYEELYRVGDEWLLDCDAVWEFERVRSKYD